MRVRVRARVTVTVRFRLQVNAAFTSSLALAPPVTLPLNPSPHPDAHQVKAAFALSLPTQAQIAAASASGTLPAVNTPSGPLPAVNRLGGGGGGGGGVDGGGGGDGGGERLSFAQFERMLCRCAAIKFAKVGAMSRAGRVDCLIRCAIGESTLEELVLAQTKRRAPARLSAGEMPRALGESVAHYDAYVRAWRALHL